MKKRVLHVIDHTMSGGAQELVGEIMRELQATTTFAVAVLGDSGDYSDRYRSLGIPVYELGGSPSKFNPLVLFRLHQVARNWHPHVLHLHLFKAYIIGSIVAAFTGCRAMVHDHTGIYPAALKFILPKHVSVIYLGLYRIVLKQVELIIVLTHKMRRAYLEHYSIDAKKIRLLPNAIRIEPTGESQIPQGGHSIRDELALARDVKIILMIGRLAPEKDWETFLRVAERFQTVSVVRVVFIVVGSGSEEENLQRFVAQHRLRNVYFLGYRRDIHSLLSQADIFLLTSRLEPFGIVVLEAMAAGCPVIATRSGGPAEILTDGQNGFLVPVGDVDRMEARIKCLLSDNHLRESIIEEALRIVRSKYTLHEYAQRMLHFYSGTT